MDPLHITEFASDRYFEKLNQLKDAQAAGTSSSQPQQQDGHVLERKTSASQGPFILPIRGSREELEEVVIRNAQKIKEKRGFLGFRSKKSASKVPTTQGIEQQVDRRPSVAESTKQRYVPGRYYLKDGTQRRITDTMTTVCRSTNSSCTCQMNFKSKSSALSRCLTY
jgi:hypothetical protein